MATPAFGTSGATPQGGFLRGLGKVAMGIMNPLGTAVNTVQNTNKPQSLYGNNSIQGQGGADYAGPQKGLIPTASTPLKKTTTNNVDGSSTTHEYHAPDTSSGKSGVSANDASVIGQAVQQQAAKSPEQVAAEKAGQTYTAPTTPQNTTPQVGNTQQNYQGVLNASQFTPVESQALSDVAAARGMQNYGALGQNAESGAYAGIDPNSPQGATQLQGLINRPDLAGRASGSANLYGNLGNIFGSASSSILSGAESQANRALGAAGTVAGASLPQQISGSSRLYNPLDGAGAAGGTGGIVTGANNQSIYDLQQQYNQGKSALASAAGLENNIVNTINSFPQLNNTPISAITNLNEILSGQTSDPAQQQLATQVKKYIDTLGLTPADISSNIASQQRGTLAQLLDSLKQNATAVNEGKNPTNLNLGSSSNTSGSTGGSSTSGFGWTP